MQRSSTAVDSNRSLPIPGVIYLTGVASTAGCLYAVQQGVGSLAPVAAAGLLGLLAATILKYGFTGGRLTLREALQDALVLAVFAASARGGLKVWQPPASWGDLLVLTPFSASLCCLVYLGAIAYTLSANRRHVSPAAGICMAGAPYLFNGLLLLQAPELLRELGSVLPFAAGLSPRLLETAGRALVLAAFNEALVSGIHLVMTGRWIREVRLHLLLVGSGVVTVFTPWIAAWGSRPELLSWPGILTIPVAVAAAITALAGLWGQIYLLTGMLMHALRGRKPAAYWGAEDYKTGLAKGAVYSGVFVCLLQGVGLVVLNPTLAGLLVAHRHLTALAAGALAFPLLKTILESFDDSERFFARLKRNYLDAVLYFRGAIVGLGFGYGLLSGIPVAADGTRFFFGFWVGVAAYAGVDLAWDGFAVLAGRRGRLQSWRLYFLGTLLGGCVGGSLAWYLDGPQLEVICRKFQQYTAIHYEAIGKSPENYLIFPLFSKWGAMNLGQVTGGVSLLYSEAVCGVINWSLAAPLFSINLVLLTALFQRSVRPIRQLFTREGVVGLIEQTVRVQRWGLWMAPVIFSFLRMSPDPTWYNQDGAVRTALAASKSLSLSPAGFKAWSLGVFTQMLAYDWLRILIWFDHMGLRVSTLVNLSFVGGDLVDEKAARFVGHTARAHCLPEGVRRFATWAPLLIPFYLPRGGEWDLAWGRAEAMHLAMGQGGLTAETALLFGFLLAAACVGVVVGVRQVLRRASLPEDGSQPECREPQRAVEVVGRPDPPALNLFAARDRYLLSNGVYSLDLLADGRGYSRVFSGVRKGSEIDITRRLDDPLQLFGRIYYLVDPDRPEDDPSRAFSVTASPMPCDGAEYRADLNPDGSIRFRATVPHLRAEAEVCVADHDPVELWRVRVTNLEDRPRRLLLTSYRELAMNASGIAARQMFFNHLHIGTWFIRPLNALFAMNRLLKNGVRDVRLRKASKEIGFHAVRESGDGRVRLVGYEDCRARFIGPETLHQPAALRRSFRKPEDEGLIYTFDPVASLRVGVSLGPWETEEVLFVDGYAVGTDRAARLVERYLGLPRTDDKALREALGRRRSLHGFGAQVDKGPEKPPRAGKSKDPRRPLFAFTEDGAEVRLSWDTPRQWAHQMANEVGYGVVVTNDGNLYSFMGNSQQNGLTPTHLDTMPAQIPGQALYLVDLDSGETASPTFTPLREREAEYGITYGRGYASFKRVRAGVRIKMTVFVPPDQPAEVRLLKISNSSDKPITLRVVPYFQMVLGEVASDSRWGIQSEYDPELEALFFTNPRNLYHRGSAFVGMSLPVETYETVRSRFVGGPGRDLRNPFLPEHGRPDLTRADDGFRIASLASTVTVPAGGEVTATIILGQAPDRAAVGEILRAYRDPTTARHELERTRRWWRNELSMLRIETEDPAFDRLVNDWLPYQVLVARLWGRCGKMQRSGGYGFRDQLQDVLPFVYLRPEYARKQILLHAAQQFVEGDVLQWWHPTWDGKTGLGARNRASDPQLWLPYVVQEYVRATGDRTILDERLPYLEGKPIPRGAEGHLMIPRPSREVGSLHQHCVKAIRLSLKRLGRNGLPLIGTGDWNDGLSAIGARGKGESVWLGFFLYQILRHFPLLATQHENGFRPEAACQSAQLLRQALDTMWRGDRYVRATTDDGRELTFADALTAAWPVISGAADFDKGARAVEMGLKELEQDGLVLLLHPPFTEDSPINPGKLADYPPGVRENGGQYSHGASWLVDALVRLSEMAERRGFGDQAVRYRERAIQVWMKISPVAHSTPETIRAFGLAPHEQPADIYFGPGYEGRGGWSWYTGAASRMLTAAYAMLGLRMRDGRLQISEAFWEGRGGLRPRRLVYNGREYVPPARAEAGRTRAFEERAP